jgi:VIT1/CCC1 family predicted Fe2+/Mn2+ transporter
MKKLFAGKMPDITPAQAVALFFGALYPVLTLVGVDLSAKATDAVEDLRVLALGLFGADAAIRLGRNYAKGKSAEAVLDAEEDVEDAEVDEFSVSPEQTGALSGSVTDRKLGGTSDRNWEADGPEGAVGGKAGEQ